MATKVISTKHILRNDTAANWLSVDPILARGEIGIETDTRKMKTGDGVTTWSGLDYIVGNGAGDVKTVTVFATANEWSGTKAPYKQTIHVDGMTATCMVMISYPAIITDVEYSAAINAGISCVAQRTGEIDLVVNGVKPDIDIPLQIMIGFNFTQDGTYLGIDKYWEPIISQQDNKIVLSFPDIILDNYLEGLRFCLLYTGETTDSAIFK